MTTITISYDCPRCNDADNEAEIIVDSGPVAARTSGLPENCSPGEGAEWHVESAVCQSCGFAPDDDWFATSREDEIQEKAAESQYDEDGPDEEPDYDYD